MTSPLIKRDGRFVKVSWNEAIGFAGERLKGLKGDRSFFIASPRCTNEENYLAQKFARVVLGTNNIDSSIRLSHSPTLVGLQGMRDSILTNPLRELDRSGCILIAGSDPTSSHPVIGTMVKKAVERGKAYCYKPRRD